MTLLAMRTTRAQLKRTNATDAALETCPDETSE
jgi:hypothetical protein